MLFLYNEVYLDIIDFEFNENENKFIVSFCNTIILIKFHYNNVYLYLCFLSFLFSLCIYPLLKLSMKSIKRIKVSTFSRKKVKSLHILGSFLIVNLSDMINQI